MSSTRARSMTAALTAMLVIAGTTTAYASGGGGGGGGGSACAPLAWKVQAVHADSGSTGIDVQATIRNCSATPETLALNVSVPNSATVPFKFSSGGAALPPGRSISMSASPIGSTPGQLHYGQTYSVVGTLTQTGSSPRTLSTLSATVTMPPGPVG